MSNAVTDKTIGSSVDDEAVFLSAFDGHFSGVLRWEQLAALWETVTQAMTPWYVYALGDDLPTEPLMGDELAYFLAELTVLLRQDHNEDYCGIVYVDHVSEPTMIKVYDPNNLGSVCGSSGKRTLPGWVLSTVRPVDIAGSVVLPNQRKRWWQKIFSVSRTAA